MLRNFVRSIDKSYQWHFPKVYTRPALYTGHALYTADYQQRVSKSGMPWQVVSSTDKIFRNAFPKVFFKLLYKWSNEQLLSLCDTYLTFHQLKFGKKAMLKQTVSSTDKIYKYGFPKLVVLKSFTKRVMSSSFRRTAYSLCSIRKMSMKIWFSSKVSEVLLAVNLLVIVLLSSCETLYNRTNDQFLSRSILYKASVIHPKWSFCESS